MKKMQTFPFLFVFLFIFCFSCKQKEGNFEINYYKAADYQLMSQYLDLPELPLSYDNKFPAYYRTPSASFDNDMATLGRVLFYDKNLSKDKTISCASCHKQELAFSDDVAFSDGIENRKTTRNSLALGSVFSFNEYYGVGSFGGVPFFWDNRASSVTEQSQQTLANENEMGMEMHQVLAAVKEQPYYAPLFEMAFDSRDIDEDKILDAISIFVNSIGSFNSKFDDAISDEIGSLSGFFGGDAIATQIKNKTFDAFTQQENLGKDLFIDNCASCHGAINGVPGKLAANNGLAINYDDDGVGELSQYTSDIGMFKVPSLRNITLTAPYMHNGQFETLEDVLDHYSNGIASHQNLSPELKTGNSPKQMNFSDNDKDALISFLETFKDDEFLTAEKYSNPFK